ncbi:alpha/beta hydrolase [Desemzia sp. RIT804]|uniref:alpha/beta hydrolase n=1 Tax=Desemzia sp. RIT 804 TaxID=2810209 RepID=UPI00194F791B|nr:alpha/beta hydrolase [Desemzia sp. RIT 804]MBM6613320.1 alpha/beta hydrolase [Desemzia sp. RIT 804]
MKHKKLKVGLLIVVALVLSLIASFAWYVSTAYEPEEEAIAALTSTNKIEVVEEEEYFVFKPIENLNNVGLIFYQGGKVEEEAYAPLMQLIAEKGIEVYLLKMPFNLAVFDSQAAGEVIEENGNISNWYVAGHSLGGVMASSFASENYSLLNGLIFLASYPSADLSQISINSLSIYGSNDKVLDAEAYEKALSKFPNAIKEIIIEGGNHAQFGNYGNQAGDGEAGLTNDSQQQQTADYIEEFIKNTIIE